MSFKDYDAPERKFQDLDARDDCMRTNAIMDMTEGRPLRLLSVFALLLLRFTGIGVCHLDHGGADLDAGGRFLRAALRFLAEKDRK